MKIKAFKVVTSLSMVLAAIAVIVGVAGISAVGFYPGIIVLVLVALIPVTSKYYAKKIGGKSMKFQRNYYTALTIVNIMVILVILWMTFVITHDHILQDCR